MGNLQAHGLAIAGGDEFALDSTHQIVNFLRFDVEVAVAGHPELVAALDLHAGEQFVHEGMNDRGEEDKVVGSGIRQRGIQIE